MVKRFLVSLVLLFAAASSHALAVFDFAFSSFMSHCSFEDCTQSPWAGTVEVRTASAADGTYQGASLILISLHATESPPAPRTSWFLTGDSSPATATISGGQVVDIHADFCVPCAHMTMRIEHLTAIYGAGSFPDDVTFGSAALQPASPPPIPEPPPWALLPIGMLAIWGAARRRR
jgi:hypothetical protein